MAQAAPLEDSPEGIVQPPHLHLGPLPVHLHHLSPVTRNAYKWNSLRRDNGTYWRSKNWISFPCLDDDVFQQGCYQCCRFGSGDPYLLLTDPDLAVFVNDLQDGNKKSFLPFVNFLFQKTLLNYPFQGPQGGKFETSIS
jgi:hypothetical protein